MKTTIDNTQRVFMIQHNGDRPHTIFCNLGAIRKVLSKLDAEPYFISHYWNGKFERISNKFVNDMLVAANSDFRL